MCSMVEVSVVRYSCGKERHAVVQAGFLLLQPLYTRTEELDD